MADVASPPIRPRILKARGLGNCWRRGGLSCIASDPTEDTERVVCFILRQAGDEGCIASDPTEDTESGRGRRPGRRGVGVASPPIRPRILKVMRSGRIRRASMIVASPPIRPRILKGRSWRISAGERRGCIASDPTEDTERSTGPR